MEERITQERLCDSQAVPDHALRLAANHRINPKRKAENIGDSELCPSSSGLDLIWLRDELERIFTNSFSLVNRHSWRSSALAAPSV
jgi:hypothetical protein